MLLKKYEALKRGNEVWLKRYEYCIFADAGCHLFLNGMVVLDKVDNGARGYLCKVNKNGFED